MSRIARLLVLVLLIASTKETTAADLPPGALVRLGDDCFRAGAAVDGLAFSPNGKQLLSWQQPQKGLLTVALWDVDTGKRLRKVILNQDLFCGAAWGQTGAIVVMRRVNVDPKTGRGTLISDDIRVWNITEPTECPPPFASLRPTKQESSWHADISRPGGRREFRDFTVSHNGQQIAILVRSAFTKKYTAEVFELRPTASVDQLKRVALLELGDFEVDQILLPPGDHTLWVFPVCGPQGQILPNGSLITWDWKTGKQGFQIDLPTYPQATSFSWDRFQLATPSGGKNGVVSIVDAISGKIHAELPLPKSVVDAGWQGDLLAFSPDGKQLLLALSREVVIIDVATRTECGRLEGHASALSALAYSPDGSQIATADHAGLIRVWNASTFRPLSKPGGHRSIVSTAELSSDGKRLLTWAKSDETVFVWDLSTGRALRAFPNVTDQSKARRSLRPTFTPDGLCVVLNTKGRLIARDIQTGLESPLPGEMATLPPGAAVFAPDGNAVLTYPLSRDSLTVWDWPSGQKRFTSKVTAPRELIEMPDDSTVISEEWLIRDPRFSTDSAMVFPAGTMPNRLDAKTGKQLSRLPGTTASVSAFTSLQFHAQRVREIASSDPVEKFLLDADADQPLFPLSSHSLAKFLRWGFVRGEVSLSPCRRWIACGSDEGGPELIEAGTGTVRRVLANHYDFTRVLGFTPDGSRLLTAGEDHTILVWDMRLQGVPLPDALKRETNAAKLWNTLATGKANESYLAMARLAHDPNVAVQIVKRRLAPAVAPSEEMLTRILHELGDEEFAVREKASKELNRYGEIVVAAVKNQLNELSVPEARVRCAAFIKKFTSDGANTERLIDARAIELLEALDTDEARGYLKQLAAGEPSAFRTQEAKRAIERNKR